MSLTTFIHSDSFSREYLNCSDGPNHYGRTNRNIEWMFFGRLSCPFTVLIVMMRWLSGVCAMGRSVCPLYHFFQEAWRVVPLRPLEMKGRQAGVQPQAHQQDTSSGVFFFFFFFFFCFCFCFCFCFFFCFSLSSPYSQPFFVALMCTGKSKAAGGDMTNIQHVTPIENGCTLSPKSIPF